jgi:hypothetical protein
MGEVYKARDTRLERLVAIKILRTQDGSEAEWPATARTQLLREARANYAALVERRMWKSVKLQTSELVAARKLLERTPPCYDAYLSFGAVGYIVGDLPFFVRWFVHYDGIEGNKRKGIEQVKLAARHGRYLGPFARILLVVASLREKKRADAEQLLAGLV